MAATYPSSDLDRPDVLLNLLGTFWHNTYQGQAVPLAYVKSRAQSEAQAHLDLLELAASASRLTVPVFHRENWLPLIMLESEMISGEMSLPHFDDGSVFDTGLAFDTPRVIPVLAWPLPAGVTDVPMITNQITGSTRTLIGGLDYVIQDGFAVFRTNPFNDPTVAVRTVLSGIDPVDQEATLWLYRSSVDNNIVYRQFGYAVGLQDTSSQPYKDAVNAVFDALVGGTTMTPLHALLSAATGIPLASQDGETVEQTAVTADAVTVVTNLNAYRFAPDAQLLVAEGDVLAAGQAMTDRLAVYQFQDIANITNTTLRSLIVGRGLLLEGFVGELSFPNTPVPLIVTADPDGYTRLSWQLGGWDDDVTMFFDLLHQRGVASGVTMAHLLDQRPVANRTSEPTAEALPATINPFQFLWQNVLRTNALLVQMRGNDVNGAGINTLRALRKIVPPQALLMFLSELEYSDAPLKMEAPGTATAPGYEESVSVIDLERGGDAMDPAAFISEHVIVRVIEGRCV